MSNMDQRNSDTTHSNCSEIMMIRAMDPLVIMALNTNLRWIDGLTITIDDEHGF